MRMRAQTVQWLAGGIAAGSIALMAGGLVLSYADRHALPADQVTWNFSNVFMNVVNLGVPVLGFVLASRRPGNRMGWLFLAAGLALGLGSFANPYALHALVAEPGSLAAGRLMAWLSNWIFVIQVALLAFLLLLFPTGRLRSRRWRPAAWFVGGALTLIGAAGVVSATRFWAHPFALAGSASPGGLTAFIYLMTAVLSSAALRYEA